MDQQAVDAITGLQNRSYNAAANIKDAFDLLLGVMLENKQITKKQYNQIRKLLVSL